MAEAVHRKLTTLMSADVAGYGRLMDVDEVDTLERLKTYRQAITGFIERHRGRVVNTAGDSLLAEFDSVVEAVQCAAEIQRELGARNAELDDTRQMLFRIGINLGDVMVEGDDLFGEGVNIAARLQGLGRAGRHLYFRHDLRSGPQQADARLRLHRRAVDKEYLGRSAYLPRAA